MTQSAAAPAPKDTKQRILDAAEELFAEHGVGASSLRSVISRADVNLAAVHYHFGSKEELLRAVVARRIDPINEERLKLLDEYERGGRQATLQQVVNAFVGPMINVWYSDERSTVIARLIGRLIGEPEFFDTIAPAQFGEIRHRFSQALARCLPRLPRDELFWRLMFMVGTATYTLRVADHLPALSDGACKRVTAEVATKRIGKFLIAGLRAGSAGE
jgi:AcrR family transcriptional regulator